MTIQAQYWVHEPGQVPIERVVELATSEQVVEFVGTLAVEHISDAFLTHADRPRVETLIPDDSESGGFVTMPDHSVICGVHGDRGALSYHGNDGHAAELVQLYSHGAGPEEPVLYETDTFPAHCEVGITVLTRALEEFLRTAKRPLGIDWQSALVHSNRAQW